MYFQHIFYILSLNKMEVTTKNFGQALKIFQKILPKTDYISFDLEFTGLRYQKFERDHINYLPYQKYKKLKYVAETYQILQLGISLVVFQDKLKVYPFNFYLFPRNPIFYDKMLCMQLGCVKFNADNGMDWNKWIRQGINYIQLSEMQQCERNSKSLKATMESLSNDNESLAQFFLKEVDRVAKRQVKANFKFPILNSSVYKLLSNIFYKYIEEKDLEVSIEYLPGKMDEEDVILITKITKKQRLQEKEKRQVELYGFTILFQQIWASKKPFIGHNCFLDLLYLHHCFIRPLPDNYFQFKELLNNSGNTFFDTKYIANKSPQVFGTQTRLQDLIKLIRQRYGTKLTVLALQNEFGRYDLDKPNLHEAGFDSYITAWVFAQMQKLRDDVHECKNILNLNFSFFKANLSRKEDEIDQYFASNLLRINLNIDMNEDVKQKRTEVVKKIKEWLAEIDNYKAYQIHEGYRQIFIEVKDKKREILKCLAKMKGKKVFTDIKTFAGYLEWQEQRVRKTAINQQRTIKGKQDNKFYKKYTKEDSVSEQSQKSEKKQGNYQKTK